MPDIDPADFMPDETPTEGPGERTVPLTPLDDEQAEWLSVALGHRVRYDHTARRWHMWNGVRWAPDKVLGVQRDVMDQARERLYRTAEDVNLTKEKREERMKLYRALLNVAACDRALVALSSRPGYGTDGADWDQDPYLLGCENGIVDLRLNAIATDAGPESLVTRTTGQDFVPFEFDEAAGTDLWTQFSARAPRFCRFLDEVTSGDRELGVFFLQWFGYSLFGHTEEQRFLMLTGIGRNGKGALVTVMRHVFGDYSADADANLYMRSKLGGARSDGARADLMALKGRRMAAMSEPDGGVFNEEMLKAHTGGDPITARALYSNSVISWVPTHSITFLTNEAPKVNDIGPSMAARVMVADFRERYDGEKEDKKLYGTLKGEAEGILAILCFVARWWHLSDKGLVLPKRIVDASNEYLNSNDPIGRYTTEACVVARGAEAYGRALYDAYVDWHARSDADGEPMTLTAFGLQLSRRGFGKRQTRQGTVYTNIRPKSAVELADA